MPESDNSIEVFKDVLTKINKPAPIFMWQNPDVILPKENQEVLIRLTCGKNRVATYDVQNKEFCVIVQPGYCTIHKLSEIAAWLPIPPYREEDDK